MIPCSRPPGIVSFEEFVLVLCRNLPKDFGVMDLVVPVKTSCCFRQVTCTVWVVWVWKCLLSSQRLVNHNPLNQCPTQIE